MSVENVENVFLPSNLHGFTFANNYSQPAENVVLPSHLHSFTSGYKFNQPMEN